MFTRQITHERTSRPPLVIGLVNNMPDAALLATDRQFCALLSAASGDFVVRLKLYSFKEINRSASARAHIDRYYDDIDELADDPPDGLIVTGAEPLAPRLQDEVYWPSLSRLVGWTRDHAVSTIWSCLAAHSAVLCADGIERVGFERKLSGLFDCEFVAAGHDLVRGAPERWQVPHSRYNGLPEDALIARGYRLLSWSPTAGADIFIKQDRGLSIFFQGHPEYGAATLLGEYRRDVGRFLDGTQADYPDLPAGYFNPRLAAELNQFREQAVATRDKDLLKAFAAIAAETTLRNPWFSTATRIYTNWLSSLNEARSHGLFDAKSSFTDMKGFSWLFRNPAPGKALVRRA